ncbi:MAG: EscU/YscU/HrcU family type III secretion system export apparatus switch protein, partial [Microvirgula sp.]
MSEKTEQPTAQRLREARSKGRVAKSADIVNGVQLLVLLAYFAVEGGMLLRALGELVNVSVQAVSLEWPAAPHALLGVFFDLVLRFGLPLALLVIGTTVATVLLQTGPVFTPDAVKPSLEKLSPLANLKQIVSLRSLFELAKSSVKLLLLSLVVYYLIRQYGTSIQFLPLCSVACGVEASAWLL